MTDNEADLDLAAQKIDEHLSQLKARTIRIDGRFVTQGTHRYEAETEEIAKDLAKALFNEQKKVAVKFAYAIDFGVFGVKSAKAVAQPSPPSAMLLSYLMKSEDALDAAANLEDLYPIWAAKYGHRHAARIFRIQAGGILIGHWFSKALRLAERLMKNFGGLITPTGS